MNKTPEKLSKVMEQVKQIHSLKKPKTIPYLIMILSFPLMCAPGIYLYLKQDKKNLTLNKKINHILEQNKDDVELRKFVIKLNDSFFIKEKQQSLVLFIGFFSFLVIAIIIIAILVARR